MGTMPPPGMHAGPAANPHHANLAKAAQAVQQALSNLFHECHQVEPDGPATQAVQKLMGVTAELVRYIETNHGVAGHGAPPTPAGPPPGAGGPPMGGSPLQGPASDLRAAMQAQAGGQ